jgi:hypothetical protein
MVRHAGRWPAAHAAPGDVLSRAGRTAVVVAVLAHLAGAAVLVRLGLGAVVASLGPGTVLASLGLDGGALAVGFMAVITLKLLVITGARPWLWRR